MFNSQQIITKTKTYYTIGDINMNVITDHSSKFII